MPRFPFLACPTVDELASFAQKRKSLKTDRQTEISEHLRTCPECARSADFLSAVEATPVAPQLPDTAMADDAPAYGTVPRVGEIWSTDVVFRGPGVPSGVPDELLLNGWVLVLGSFQRDLSREVHSYAVVPVTDEPAYAADWSWVLAHHAVDRMCPVVAHLDFQATVNRTHLRRPVGRLVPQCKTELFELLAAYDRGDALPRSEFGYMGPAAFRGTKDWMELESSLESLLDGLAGDFDYELAGAGETQEASEAIVGNDDREAVPVVRLIRAMLNEGFNGDLAALASRLQVSVDWDDLRPVLSRDWTDLSSLKRLVFSQGVTDTSRATAVIQVLLHAQNWLAGKQNPTASGPLRRAARHQPPCD